MKPTEMIGSSKKESNKKRLNKSGACRCLNWKTKQLEDALAECKRILGGDDEDE